MAGKFKIPLALWIAFIVVDLAIVGAVLAAVYWVAPVPTAFSGNLTLAQARAAKPSGLTVAVVTADYCLACQIYKRGALSDPRVAAWVSDNAGAAYLKWGADESEIESISVARYPATVVLAGQAVLATHYGAMSADDLLTFLQTSVAELPSPEAAPAPQEPGAPEAAPAP